MKQISTFLLCLVGPALSTLSAQEWVDYAMPDDSTILHKMCQVEDHCWAVDYGNGRVYKSEKEGRSWILQYESGGEFLEAIQFLDKNTGFLCGDYGLIMKTEDGGDTWQDIGPAYAPRITKTDAMEGDSAALERYFYQMYFKNVDQGLAWGFEVNPTLGWGASSVSFFYQTADGGETWKRIEYTRDEYDGIVQGFLQNHSFSDVTAFGIYRHKDVFHNLSTGEIMRSTDRCESWQKYPLPQLPEGRNMLRTMHFVSDHQGYIFGGDLKEPSQGHIIETLDRGETWRPLQTDFPHVHYTLQNEQEILLAGKDGLLTKWKPALKADSSFMHRGDASRILIDGTIGRDEWVGANRTTIKNGVDLYTLHDDHFVYLSVQFDTALFTNYYCDLYLELGADSVLNLHASQQIGERTLVGSDWTDSEPPFAWGYISDWTANTMSFDRANRIFIPYTAMEFKVAKSKLPEGQLKIALQCRDVNWEEEIINVPADGDFHSSEHWLRFHLE